MYPSDVTWVLQLLARVEKRTEEARQAWLRHDLAAVNLAVGDGFRVLFKLATQAITFAGRGELVGADLRDVREELLRLEISLLAVPEEVKTRSA